MTKTCDALIIGAGPAGATAALLLAEAGWSVVVLERKTFPRRKVCGEYLSATNWPLLERLGLAEEFSRRAGPEVRRVGLFAGRTALVASLPLPEDTGGRWGRALGREHLDTMLLARAADAGAQVLQPWRAETLHELGDEFVCHVRSENDDSQSAWRAPIVIAAHGSWGQGSLPSQLPAARPRSDDLFGFKAHFEHTTLPSDLMPLVSFPGGYGGLVHAENGRVGLSCCVRRDVLARLDRKSTSAGDAVLRYLRATTPVLDLLLTNAQRQETWLSAGPIRPGIRAPYVGGVFRVGNAAGEAHPVVAEGISMAAQSSWVLVQQLLASRASIVDRSGRDAIARQYRHAWRRSFAARIRAAAAIAHWAMRPSAVRMSLPVVRQFPSLLTWGARLSGKATQVVSDADLIART